MNSPQSTASPGWREVALASVAIAAAMGLAVAASGSSILFTRPFWIDEVHTALLAGRSSPLAVIADLHAGADYGPPLVPLATWALRVVAGGLAPVTLRVFAFLTVVGALTLVYATLRRRCTIDVSVAGVAALGVHPLVAEHAFEGRFYGPWLLCSAFFGWCLGDDSGTRASRIRLGVAAVLLCTVHWYGVITLSIMAAGAVAAAGSGWRRAVVSLAPAAAGIAALALCVPLAAGQHHALTVATWVPDFTPAQVSALAKGFWTATVPATAAALLGLGLILRRRAGRDTRDVLSLGADPGIAAFFALLSFPLALAALSMAGQPSMIARYAMPTTLAWAALAALAAAAVGRWPTRALVLVLAWLWIGAYAREGTRKFAFATGVAADHKAFLSARGLNHGPVVFQSMHTLYALAGADSANRADMWFMELPDSTFDALFGPDARFFQLNKSLRVERDVVRVHTRRFGFPHVVTQQALDTTPHFVLVANDFALPRGYTNVMALATLLFPRHRATQVSAEVTVFDRPPAGGKVPARLQNTP